MASRPRRPGRLLLPAILGAILAGEITGIALAQSLPAVVLPVASPAPVTAAAAADPQRLSTEEAGSPRDSRAELVRTGVDLAARQAPRSGPVAAGHALTIAPKETKTRVASAGSGGSTQASTSAHRTGYHGVNHVWIPSLGINKGIQSFPCSRSRPPDAGVYRWGCAGTNNVYLLSHAWSTFKPLHDAYVRGTLRKGMAVWYADGAGRVHEYRVLWWRVTAPTTAASWAWAPLASPGMTLQTCVGAASQYRLMVRLDRVG